MDTTFLQTSRETEIQSHLLFEEEIRSRDKGKKNFVNEIF